jgi:transcriptional regulator with XRE-family HTH domain
MSVSKVQIRMARAALGWTIRDLADKAGIHRNTALRIETGQPGQSATLQIIQRVMEDHGIIFLDAQEGRGPGVATKLNANIPSAASSEGLGNEGGRTEGGAKALDYGMAAHWARYPDRWSALPEIGRHVLSEEMFGDPYAADEAFGI